MKFYLSQKNRVEEVDPTVKCMIFKWHWNIANFQAWGLEGPNLLGATAKRVEPLSRRGSIGESQTRSGVIYTWRQKC